MATDTQSGLVLPNSSRPATSTLIHTDLDEQLYEGKLWSGNVALMLFAGVNGFKSSYYGIGTPRVEGIQPKPNEMFISGLTSEKARSLQTVNSDVFQPLFKIRPIDPNITRHTSYYDNNSMMSDWATNTLPQTLVRGAAKWVYSALEVVISTDEQYWIQAGGAIPKLSLNVETARDRQSTLMSQVDTDWHTASGPASVTSDYWSAPYSFQVQCDATSVVFGIDKSDAKYAGIVGNYNTASTPASFHDLYMSVNYSTSTTGWASGIAPELDKFRMRIRYFLVNGDLYQKAVVEAETRGTKPVTMDAIPEMQGYGFKSTAAVSINDQCWVIHDPKMPAGHVFGCNPSVWSIGFRKSFQLGSFFDHGQIRNQPRIKSAQMEALYMGPVCHAPWTQAYWTSVA